MKENQPIIHAQRAREKITEALKTQTPINLQLSNEIAACILGLPKKNLEKYGLSSLIYTDKSHVNFLVADNEEIALQAFRNWQQDQNPRIATTFKETQYLTLYRIIQAIAIGQGDKIIKGVEGLILKLLEEDDEKLSGLYNLIIKNSAIPKEDIQQLHIYLTQIWENLPKSIQLKNHSFSPNNVFNI